MNRFKVSEIKIYYKIVRDYFIEKALIKAELIINKEFSIIITKNSYKEQNIEIPASYNTYAQNRTLRIGIITWSLYLTTLT